MSIKCLNTVWEYSIQKGSALLLLLSIADYAKDNGYAFPGVKVLARKTRMSERQVLRLVEQVEKSGELSVNREKRYNRYIVNVWPPEGPKMDVCSNCKIPGYDQLDNPLKQYHIIPLDEGGADHESNLEWLCYECFTRKNDPSIGDILTRDNLSLITPIRDKLSMKGDILEATSDIFGSNGDIAMSPYPFNRQSLNRKEGKDMSLSPDQKIFNRMMTMLHKDMPRSNYDKWVDGCTFLKHEEGLYYIQVRDEESKQWLEDHLESTLLRILAGMLRDHVEVRFVVADYIES